MMLTYVLLLLLMLNIMGLRMAPVATRKVWSLGSVLERSGGGMSETSQRADEEDIQAEGPTKLEAQSRRIRWTAQARASCRIKETKRTARQYMALPASDYSVLSAQQIERLSDTQFKAILGKLNFFGTVIIPVLYVDVNVFPEEARAEICVSRAETVGSEMAEKVSGTFKISAVNLVSAGMDDKNRPTLNSDTSLFIDVIVPDEAKVPLRLIQSGGNFIIQSSLNLIVPTFVRILAADFKRWSAGDDARTAVENASLTL